MRILILALVCACLSARPAAAQLPQLPGIGGPPGLPCELNPAVAGLTTWIRESRNTSRSGSTPMPAGIQRALAEFIDDGAMKGVHYRIEDKGWFNVASTIFRHGQAIAVTLDDTIVFRSQEDANNLVIWAHEMQHVIQYNDAGSIEKFACAYLNDYAGIEDRATTEENKMARALDRVHAPYAYSEAAWRDGWRYRGRGSGCHVIGMRRGNAIDFTSNWEGMRDIYYEWRVDNVDAVRRVEFLDEDGDVLHSVDPDRQASGSHEAHSVRIKLIYWNGKPDNNGSTDVVCFRVGG